MSSEYIAIFADLLVKLKAKKTPLHKEVGLKPNTHTRTEKILTNHYIHEHVFQEWLGTWEKI